MCRSLYPFCKALEPISAMPSFGLRYTKIHLAARLCLEPTGSIAPHANPLTGFEGGDRQRRGRDRKGERWVRGRGDVDPLDNLIMLGDLHEA